MKNFLFLFLLIGNIHGSDLDELQTRYNVAVERAVAPINKVYVDELRKLLERESKMGNLEEVAKITLELKNVIPQKEGVIRDNSDLEKLFVDKKWKTPFGTTLAFQKNGQGMKTTGADTSPFTWRIIEDNLVEYNGRVTSTAPIKTEYIKFISKKEAYIGRDRNQIVVALTPVDN